MSNPYNKDTEELYYNTWEHGFSSTSANEFPYESATLEYDELRPIWMKGFNEGKKSRPAPKVENKKAPGRPKKEQPEANDTFNANLVDYDDEALYNELRLRKQSEYQTLLKAQRDIEVQINKLKWLFE